MEKLIILFVAVLCSIQTFFSSFENQYIYQSNTHISGGVITIEEMILSVILDDPFDKIEGVKVYNSIGELVKEKNGCYQEKCTYSFVGMQSGVYEVQVSVQNGSGFSGHFIIQ